MKTFITVGAIAALVLGASAFDPENPNIEVAPYTVDASTADYEIRTYPAQKWVSSKGYSFTISGSEEQSRVFNNLFQYIDGNNEAGRKIDMTSPVPNFVIPGAGPNCEQNFTMNFYVPAVEQDDPPAPLDPEVFITEKATTQVAAAGFDGFATDAMYIQAVNDMYKALLRDNIPVEAATYYIVGYDSPFTLTNRLNEVWMVLTEPYNGA